MKQETQFSLFRALSTKQPPTLITLEEVYRLITTDNSLRGNTEKFRYFNSHGFEKEADEIKRTRCPAFTPAAVFEQYRRYNCITTITQYSMVDIDNLTEAEVQRLMDLLKADPYWLLAYITLSGKGIRIIFRVEGVTDQKSYLKDFYQGNDHYCRLLKAFERIELKKGESKTVTFNLGKQELSMYNAQLEEVVEPGDFKVMVGAASDDIRLEGMFKL